MSRTRAFVPELPRSAWTLVVGGAISAVGSGLTLPFLLVYLHQVRHLPPDIDVIDGEEAEAPLPEAAVA